VQEGEGRQEEEGGGEGRGSGGVEGGEGVEWGRERRKGERKRRSQASPEASRQQRQREVKTRKRHPNLLSRVEKLRRVLAVHPGTHTHTHTLTLTQAQDGDTHMRLSIPDRICYEQTELEREKGSFCRNAPLLFRAPRTRLPSVPLGARINPTAWLPSIQRQEEEPRLSLPLLSFMPTPLARTCHKESLLY